MTTHEDIIRRIDRADETSAAVREKIAATLSRIETTQLHHGSVLTAMHSRVATLEASDNVRSGERGVLAAIARSPFVAYFVAGCVGIWAFVTNAGALKP